MKSVTKSQPVQVTLSPDMHKRFAAAARRNRLSIEDTIRILAFHVLETSYDEDALLAQFNEAAARFVVDGEDPEIDETWESMVGFAV